MVKNDRSHVGERAVLHHLRGEPQRLQFSAVQRVRRDLLTGGVVLTGKLSKVRVPATLADRCRAAIASQRKGALRSQQERPDDPLRFMG